MYITYARPLTVKYTNRMIGILFAETDLNYMLITISFIAEQQQR